MNLRAGGDPADLFRDLEGPLVLVADELTPSLIAQLDWQRLAALVTDAGSWTYHTAILARSIHVPAVAGLRNASARHRARARCVAVDGATGEVLVDPDDADAARRFAARQRRRAAYEQSLDEFRRAAGRHRGRRRRSGSKPTSSRRTTPARARSAARRASGCSAPSSCSPAAARRR